MDRKTSTNGSENVHEWIGKRPRMDRKTSTNRVGNPCYQKLLEGLKALKSFKNI